MAYMLTKSFALRSASVLLAVVSLAQAGCRPAATGLRVIVIADFDQPELTGVELFVHRVGGMAGQTDTQLRRFQAPLGPGQNAFPLRYTVYLSGGANEMVRLEAHGHTTMTWGQGAQGPNAAGMPAVSTSAIVGFVPGQVRTLQLVLTRACVNASVCSPGSTCVPSGGGATCVSAMRNANELPVYDPNNESVDAMVQPGEDVPNPPGLDVPDPPRIDVPTPPFDGMGGGCGSPALGMPATIDANYAGMAGFFVSPNVLALQRNITSEPNSYQLLMASTRVVGMGTDILRTTRIRYGGRQSIALASPMGGEAFSNMPLDAVQGVTIPADFGGDAGMMMPGGTGFIGVSGRGGPLNYAAAGTMENMFASNMGGPAVMMLRVPATMTSGNVVDSKSFFSTSIQIGNGMRVPFMGVLERNMGKLRCTLPDPNNVNPSADFTVFPVSGMVNGPPEQLIAVGADALRFYFLTESSPAAGRALSSCQADTATLPQMPMGMQNLNARCDVIMPSPEIVPGSFGATYIESPVNCPAAGNQAGEGWYVSFLRTVGNQTLLHAGRLDRSINNFLQIPVVAVVPSGAPNPMYATAVSVAPNHCQMLVAVRAGMNLFLAHHALGGTAFSMTNMLPVAPGAAFRLSSNALTQGNDEGHILVTVSNGLNQVEVRAIPHDPMCRN